jgi:hypothetical protein
VREIPHGERRQALADITVGGAVAALAGGMTPALPRRRPT